MRAPTFALSLFTLAACATSDGGPWVPAPPVPDATVVLDTSMGVVTVHLDGTKAPLSTTNFLAYVDAGDYDGVVFHRVINGFMIQGGGFDESLTKRATRDTIRNESRNGLRNVKGTLAMARTSNPDSASSQFFINVADNAFLDYPGTDGYGYAVFGQVTAGLEIVDRIKVLRTGTQDGMSDVPLEAVVIRTARRGE